MEPKFKNGDIVRLNFAPQSKYVVIGGSFKVQHNTVVANENHYWLQSISIQSEPSKIHEFSESELELDN